MAAKAEDLIGEIQSLQVQGGLQESASQSPRQTLPLPPELRDSIYGYLLYHENVHEEPWHTRTESERGQVWSQCCLDKSW